MKRILLVTFVVDDDTITDDDLTTAGDLLASQFDATYVTFDGSHVIRRPDDQMFGYR